MNTLTQPEAKFLDTIGKVIYTIIYIGGVVVGMLPVPGGR